MGDEDEAPEYGTRTMQRMGARTQTAGADVLRVVRGGSWFYPQYHSRAASRFRDFPSSRSDGRGFRVVFGAPHLPVALAPVPAARSGAEGA